LNPLKCMTRSKTCQMIARPGGGVSDKCSQTPFGRESEERAPPSVTAPTHASSNGAKPDRLPLLASIRGYSPLKPSAMPPSCFSIPARQAPNPDTLRTYCHY
jgi:hypothetical protein